MHRWHGRLPILRCRERIETRHAPMCATARQLVSLYFGVGSGLKLHIRLLGCAGQGSLPILRCRERIETGQSCKIVVSQKVSLYFGVGSGLKHIRYGGYEFVKTRVSLYFGVGSGLKQITGRPTETGTQSLPILRCRERIETVKMGR